MKIKKTLPEKCLSNPDLHKLIMLLLPIPDQIFFNSINKKWGKALTFTPPSRNGPYNLFVILKYDGDPLVKYGCRKCNSGRYLTNICGSKCFQNGPLLLNPITQQTCFFLSDEFESYKREYAPKLECSSDDFYASIMENLVFCLCL